MGNRTRWTTLTIAAAALALFGAGASLALTNGGQAADLASAVARPAGAEQLAAHPAAQPERGAKVPVRVFPHQMGPEVILYDNGPLVNFPGGGAGGADASRLQDTTLGMNTYGSNVNNTLGYRLSDDFTVVDPDGWNINTITVFVYQTGSTTTSTINSAQIQIWNGDPSAGGVVVFGDLTTNRMLSTTWTNIYRDLESAPGASNRPIMQVVIGVGGLHLDPGTYWIDFSTTGSLASGPWGPPVTILGQSTTGDGMQWTGAAWNDLIDVGPQGVPFVVEGSVGPGAPAVTLTKTVSDVLGVCGASDTITVTNETPVDYCFTIQNTGTSTLNYHTLVDDHLGTILDNANIVLSPGGTHQVLVTDIATTTVTNTATVMSYESLLTMDSLTVGFNTFSHTWPDDIDILLVGPGGESLVLWSDVGGSTDLVGVNVVLDDAAATLLPDNGPILTGSYRPSNVGLSNTEFPAPAPPAPWGQPAPAGADTLTSIFGGGNPNGTWGLYVRDDTGGDSGTIAEWCLTLQPSATTVCNSTGVTIPSSGNATPYPSTLDVGGAPDASSSDTATVTVLNPDAVVDPVSMSSLLYPGDFEGQTLTIENNGDGQLNWDLFESSTFVGEVRLELETPNAPVPLIVDDGSRENSIGLTAGGQFIWLNRFTPAPTAFPFQLTEISVLFGAGVGVNIGELVDLYVYEDTDGDGDPGTGANFLGSQIGAAVQAVDDVTFSVYPLTTPIALNGPGDVLIAVVNRTAGTAAGTFVASIDQTPPSQVRSWIGLYSAGNPGNPPTLPADALWGTIDSLGFAGNWMVRGLGDQQVSCTAPEDLPWLGVTQNSGSTPPLSSSLVQVTFYAGALPLGTYEGTLCLESNDPDSPIIPIPVTMVIDTMPFIDGFEIGNTSRWSVTVP